MSDVVKATISEEIFAGGGEMGQVMRNTAGNVREWIGTVTDISDRKQAEEHLRLANERFELAAAAVNCLIYDWDIERDVVARTEGLTRILGYSLAEAEPTAKWWCQLVHPEDLQRIENEAAIVFTKSDRYIGEYRVRNKNEDITDSGEFLVFVLEQYGAIAMATASAQEAFEALQQFQPDVVVSDIGMPGEDGYTLIRKIRELAPEQGGRVPAIALTAYAKDEDRDKALSAGFQKHLSKPIEPAELASTVANLLTL